MKKIGLFLLLGFSLSWLVSACQERQQERRKEVPLDSIVLSDPCITIIMVVFMLCVLVCFPLEKEVRVSAASVIGMQFRERKI